LSCVCLCLCVGWVDGRLHRRLHTNKHTNIPIHMWLVWAEQLSCSKSSARVCPGRGPGGGVGVRCVAVLMGLS
jgi:hypothetical protein